MPRKKSATRDLMLTDVPAGAVAASADINSARAGLLSIAGSKPAGSHVPALAETVAQIRYWHRQRCFAMEQRKRMDLALGAFLRTMLGWSKDKPDAERKEIAKRAADLLDATEDHEWSQVIAASKLGRKPYADIEARAVKEMSALVMTLPVWGVFGEGVRGFGAASLAVIVAEAGDLSNYANPAKLWKRMGLAVVGNVRQGGLAKGAGADAWIEHGYSPQRRSRVWNIGDALIKGNRNGKYRTVYLERKTYELARDPGMQPIKAHRRAQRYMEKRLLKNLWQAWRRAIVSVTPGTQLPVATNSAQADDSTSAVMQANQALSSHPTPVKAGKRRAKPVTDTVITVPAARQSPKGERSTLRDATSIGRVSSVTDREAFA